MLSQIISIFLKWLQAEQVQTYFQAALVFLLGLVLSRIVSRRLKLKKLPEHKAMLVKKALAVVIVVVSFVWT